MDSRYFEWIFSVNSSNRYEMQESPVYSLDLIGEWCWRTEVSKVVVWKVVGEPGYTLISTDSGGLAEVLFVHLTYFSLWAELWSILSFCNSFENNKIIDKYLHRYKKKNLPNFISWAWHFVFYLLCEYLHSDSIYPHYAIIPLACFIFVIALIAL